MRRMKIEPMTFYPVTEYQNIDPSDDYVNFYLNEGITKIIKKSPHAITMVFDEAAISNNYGGSVFVKMFPTRLDPNYSGDMIFSYFGAISVDDDNVLVVYGSIDTHDKRPIFTLSQKYKPELTTAHFGQIFKTRLETLENIGHGIGNLINYSIEPVSDSLIIETADI